MLKIENISFAYTQKPVLNNVSMNIGKGEFVAILGANGAGKSTLIKIVSGFLKPKGDVKIKGKSIFKMSARELALSRAVLEQETNLEFNYTVLDTVSLGRFAMSGFFGIDSHSKDIAELALEKVGLKGFENKQYLQLSGGERRRVHLARVLAQVLDAPQDKLLLLDEPTANLDPKHSYKTMEICREICQLGASCVAVVHSVEHAMNFADKTAMISNNTLLKFGDTAKIITPENITALFGMNCEIVGSTHKTVVLY